MSVEVHNVWVCREWRERECLCGEIERGYVCREIERERECMCKEIERDRVCVERERERERECVCVLRD